MKSKYSDEENAFHKGLQDNTVKLSDDREDPKSSVTKQDRQVTNEEGQNIITVEVDDHDREREENPVSVQKNPATDDPVTDNRNDPPGKTETEK
jgi:hypothetical protein